ncbi:hypothetical protein P4U23_08125 [Aeribacillus composti]|uniref:hypothetical protein n=1 Tax=Aeribacillus composti TaxID=1868734 RepID=UPI002E1B180E|nr:hypothetical protein [Aeribacillus composti]
MKTFWLIISLLLVIFAFFYNLLGLMNLVPIFVSAPLLFISLFISFLLFNHRKTFRGF